MDYPAEDEGLIRKCLGKCCTANSAIGRVEGWSEEDRYDGIHAIEWRTKNKSGTQLGGACTIHEGTRGAAILIAEIAYQKSHKEVPLNFQGKGKPFPPKRRNPS